jgi:hypothetical protein
VKRFFTLLIVICLAPAAAFAHRASDSYLALSATHEGALEGHWDVALSDLAYALALDDGDGVLRWGELRAHEAEVDALLRAGLLFAHAEQSCALSLSAFALVQLSDGPYARVPFSVTCGDGGVATKLRATLLAEVDRDHRILLRVGNGDEAATYVLGKDNSTLVLPRWTDARAGSPMLRALRAQVGRGLQHIFEGTDHIAFLLVLLLPAVFRRRSQALRRAALVSLSIEIAKVVTAFTVAHSLTLSLAAFGLVRTSADVIEPAIAVSVALAAASNLRPGLFQEGYLLAFALGLLHGFGFSSALADAGLSGSALLAALLGFNLGVELGQLAIVALFVPLALLSARLRPIRSYALPCGSAAVLALALFWVFERLQTG